MVAVPESILKKRATAAKNAEATAAAATAATEAAATLQATAMINAEKYAKEYASTEANNVAQRRAAKASGGFYVPEEPKLALVIRIRGIIGVSPKAKKVMRLFRLLQLHNATFVRLNEATIRMLKLIEPYVAYGYPSLKTVKQLIYKRGFGKINKQRIPIADNTVISEVLSEAGVQCCADLVHEIITVGPNFKQANNFLWPFKLSSPKGGFSSRTKLLHFMEGGEAGNRGEEIDALVQKMI